jgi:uncharacterized protein involved in high-affinity Fe2+ transport
MRSRIFSFLLVLPLLLTTPAAVAASFEIGQPLQRHGLNIQAMYIQAVEVHGEQHHHPAGHEADAHLEARITLAADNPYGLPEGAWMPYLGIRFKLSKAGDDWATRGVLEPMFANDGPHYGGNVKLAGGGKYKVELLIDPPQLPYHTDKETGHGGWWQPFTTSWDFVFLGTGKKGGY